MRCWVCPKLIMLPEIIGGHPGIAGEIRNPNLASAAEPVPGWEARCVAYTIACPHCKTQYRVTTEQLSGEGVQGATNA